MTDKPPQAISDDFAALANKLTLLASQWHAKGAKLHEIADQIRLSCPDASEDVARVGDMWIARAGELFDLVKI